MITVGKVGEQKYNETQGHYTKHCVRFTNDIDMSGMKICIDVALFKENTDGLQKISPAYCFDYPTSFPTNINDVPLTGLPVSYQNYIINVVAIDAFNFDVEVKFFMLADTNNYLFSIPNFDPYVAWTNKGYAAYPTVYDSPKAIIVKATLSNGTSLEVSEAPQYFVAKEWEQTDYRLYIDHFTNPKSVNGWVSGKDLTIYKDYFGDWITSKVVVGIIRDTSTSNTIEFWKAIRMQTASMAGTYMPIEDIDFNKIIDGIQAKLISTGQYQSYFTIKGDYFQPGESYRLFWIYRDGNEWKSALSDSFSEDLQNSCEEIKGDVTYSIQVEGDAPQIGNNISKVAPCQKLKLCAELDQADWNTIINGRGYVGDIYGYLRSIEIYTTSVFQPNAPKINNYSSDVYLDGSNYKFCVDFIVPEKTTDEEFLFIKLNFEFGTEKHEIIFPFRFDIAEYSSDPTAPTVAEQVCSDSVGESEQFNFTYADATAKMYAYKGKDKLVSDVDYTGNDGSVTIDFTKLEEGEKCCIKVVAQKFESIASCPCGEILFRRSNGNRTIEYDLTPMYTASTLLEVFFLRKVNGNWVNWYNSTSLTGSFFAPSPSDLYIYIKSVNGCFNYAEIPFELDATNWINIFVCHDETVTIPTTSLPCQKRPKLTNTCAGISGINSLLNLDGGTLVSHAFTKQSTGTLPVTGVILWGTDEEIFIEAVINFPSPCGQITLHNYVSKRDCIEQDCGYYLDNL
jgi:hypothetical protein